MIIAAKLKGEFCFLNIHARTKHMGLPIYLQIKSVYGILGGDKVIEKKPTESGLYMFYVRYSSVGLSLRPSRPSQRII